MNTNTTMVDIVKQLKAKIHSIYLRASFQHKQLYLQVLVKGRWYKPEKIDASMINQGTDIRIIIGNNEIIIEGTGKTKFRSSKFKPISLKIVDLDMLYDMDVVCRQVKQAGGLM